MKTKNLEKPERRDHSLNRDESTDVSSDPTYFSLDSPFKHRTSQKVNVIKCQMLRTITSQNENPHKTIRNI
jgi:hypothetical protein